MIINHLLKVLEMRILKYISVLAAAAGLFSACQELEEVRTFAPGDVIAPVLHSLPSEISVTSENMGSTVTFTWDAADFGVNTQIDYSIEAVYNSDTVAVITGLTATSSELTYEVLNSVLFLPAENGGLGVAAGIPTEVHFLVGATIGDTFGTYYSEGVPVTVTVTEAERTYPMVYVIGDFCGWADGQTQKLFSFSGDEVNYSGVIGFGGKAANGFKIRGTETGWADDSNWGTDGEAAAPEAEAASIQLISSAGSGNISAYSKNFYRFSFNRTSMVLAKEISFDQLGVVGDFNGWGSDVVMNFDTQKQIFWADVEFPAEGVFKVRADAAWDVSWGVAATGAASVSGILDGGNNITAPAGNYRLYVNLNNAQEMTWELNAADYAAEGGEEPEPEPEATWVVHGQSVATPDWGDIPMESASSNLEAYKAAGVEVTAGSQFGFKDPDGQWYAVDTEFAAGANPYTVTVGTAFAVSTSSVNAEVAEAGTYDYWILPALGRGYVVQAGVKPEYVPDTYGIVGTVNGWGDIGDLSMTEEGAYYVRKGVALVSSDAFKIRFNNEWNDAANYGTASGGAIDINTAVPVVTSGGSQNMSVTLDGTYDIYFDLANSLVYVMTAGSTPEGL